MRNSICVRRAGGVLFDDKTVAEQAALNLRIVDRGGRPLQDGLPSVINNTIELKQNRYKA
jgi:hypothetical protein